MKKMDKDGLILCKMQGDIFEQSTKLSDTSSEIFIRRFMNSDVAKEFDSAAFLDDTLTIRDVFDRIDGTYGKSEYGSFKYHPEVLFWIGYLYRYFSYTYEFSSKRVYGMLKPRGLKSAYYPYHTLDCSQAIERLLEEKGINVVYENSNEKLLELIKEVTYENKLLLEEKDNGDIEAKYKNNVVASIGIVKNEEDSLLFSVKAKENKYRNNQMEKALIEKLCDYSKNVMKARMLKTSALKSDKQRIVFLEKSGFIFDGESRNTFLLSKVLN